MLDIYVRGQGGVGGLRTGIYQDEIFIMFQIIPGFLCI
jgi:hypothetical protein